MCTCVNFRVNTSRDFVQLKTITDCRLTKLFIAVEAYERCRCPAEPRLIGKPSLRLRWAQAAVSHAVKVQPAVWVDEGGHRRLRTDTLRTFDQRQYTKSKRIIFPRRRRRRVLDADFDCHLSRTWHPSPSPLPFLAPVPNRTPCRECAPVDDHVQHKQ